MTTENKSLRSPHDARPSGAVSLVELLIWMVLIGSITATFLLVQTRVGTQSKTIATVDAEMPSNLRCVDAHFGARQRPDDGGLTDQLCAYRMGQPVGQGSIDPQTLFTSSSRP